MGQIGRLQQPPRTSVCSRCSAEGHGNRRFSPHICRLRAESSETAQRLTTIRFRQGILPLGELLAARDWRVVPQGVPRKPLRSAGIVITAANATPRIVPRQPLNCAKIRAGDSGASRNWNQIDTVRCHYDFRQPHRAPFTPRQSFNMAPRQPRTTNELPFTVE